MLSTLLIRPATFQDLTGILHIYNLHSIVIPTAALMTVSPISPFILNGPPAAAALAVYYCLPWRKRP